MFFNIVANWRLRMYRVPESLVKETSVTEKVVHITDLFIWRKYISDFSWIKESHLENFSNTKLFDWILVNDGTLRNNADFASALDNVNKVKIWKSLVVETYTSKKLYGYENIHGEDFFTATLENHWQKFLSIFTCNFVNPYLDGYFPMRLLS